MDNFLAISIVGVIASFIIEGINKLLGLDSFKAKIATLVVSFVLGGAYFLFNGTAIWETFIGILGASSAVYAFFLKKK